MKYMRIIPIIFLTIFAIHPAHSDDSKQAKKPITLGFIMGKFQPRAHPDFVVVSSKHANRNGLYLQKSAYHAFKKMRRAALQSGVNLTIHSATRNFDYQRGIWERKWTGKKKVGGVNLARTNLSPAQRAKKILSYSSMPGSSRHHWGTDIDLNSFNNKWFESGKGLRLYQWLQANAANYGFCQVYTQKDAKRPNGYEEEKWHWSYVPLSAQYTRFAESALYSDEFDGFKGAKVAQQVGIVENYVLGINRECLKNY